jgi:inosose dehydratase
LPVSNWAINSRAKRLLGPILQRHDLQLVSGWYSGRLLERSVEEEIAAVQSHLTLLRELGEGAGLCGSERLHSRRAADPGASAPAFPQARWKEYGEKLTNLPAIRSSRGADCLPSPYGHGD